MKIKTEDLLGIQLDCAAALAIGQKVDFDATGLIAGLILLTCGIFNLHVDLLVKLGLGISVAFLTVLLVAEMFHVVGAGYFRFHPAIIFEIYSVVNLMQLAFEYQPRR